MAHTASVNSAPLSPANSTENPIDDLARVFNTAVIATRSTSARDFSAELQEVVDSPAFRAILQSVRQLSRLQGITERQAAEQFVVAFRKLDQIWSDYIFQEGIDRLRSQGSPN